MSALDDLLDYIFDGQKPVLYAEFAEWVRASRRFRDFAVYYRSKIRAKLRYVQNEDSLNDVRAELETAALLLSDRRFTLEYEKYAALKQRGPDFTVTFKTHTPFNVEVRRIRSFELNSEDRKARTGKLIAVLCDKIGQMPPSIVNLLWLISEGEIAEADLIRAERRLRRQAERKAEVFFKRRGFQSVAGFHKQYRRLSGIVLRRPGETVLWLNALARHEAPRDIVLALRRLEVD